MRVAPVGHRGGAGTFVVLAYCGPCHGAFQRYLPPTESLSIIIIIILILIVDEGLNRTLAQVAAGSHRAVWH